MVRSTNGIEIVVKSALTNYEEEKHTVNAIFFLMSPENEPGLHLRMLAQIAGRVEKPEFREKWNLSQDHQELKEAILQDEQHYSVTTKANSPWVNLMVIDSGLPKDCEISMINKGGHIFVPDDRTFLEVGDRLTIIGPPEYLADLKSSKKQI